ncbi:MAG: DNA polymerase III subunit beta [Fimbriimonadaceae bacterium]
MKATVSRKELNDALSIAASASSARSTQPALMSIRMTLADGKLTLLGCDGEMWAQAYLPASIEVEGEICVQTRFLTEVVGALPDEQVTLQLSGTSLVIEGGQSEWKLFATPADLFPGIPDVPSTGELSLPMGLLQDSLDAVTYAVSSDTTRGVLTGVLMNYDGRTLTLVATDTHRLAVNRVHREGVGSDLNYIVPEKALKTIRSLPVPSDEDITIRFDGVRMSVDVGTAQVVSQLLDGNYPNWQRVVPSEFTRQWTMDRKEFYDNLKRAAILARDNSNRVTLSGQGDKVVISARSDERGTAKEEVPVISQNGDIDIAFNVKFIMDALNAFDSEGVRTEMTEASRSAVIRPVEGGEDRFCVVMPMALG